MRRISAWLVSNLVLVAVAAAQPRVDYRSPVVGGSLELTIDGASPYADLIVTLSASGRTDIVGSVVADASGTARLRLPPIPESAAGTTYTFAATDRLTGKRSEEVAVEIERPSLLLTGIESGRAVLWRVPLDLDAAATTPFRSAEVANFDLGTGRPGGAVRDGRASATFVISDVETGILRVIPDSGAPSLSLELGPNLRGIETSPDGRTILVAAAGRNGENGRLIILPADEPANWRALDLGYSLGRSGGRIVVSSDGLRAFVSLDGAFLRDVDLLHDRTGSKLISVGAASQDEIRDLRIVAGNLFALTGRAGDEERPASVAGLDVANPKKSAVERTFQRDEELRIGSRNGKVSLFLLDGSFGEITVIDVATMAKQGSFTVPAGADALLLSPDTRSSLGALLYRAETPQAAVRAIDLAKETVGAESALGLAARATNVSGHSDRIDLLFVEEATGRRLLALTPDSAGGPLRVSSLPLGMSLLQVSVGD